MRYLLSLFRISLIEQRATGKERIAVRFADFCFSLVFLVRIRRLLIFVGVAGAIVEFAAHALFDVARDNEIQFLVGKTVVNRENTTVVVLPQPMLNKFSPKLRRLPTNSARY